MITSSDFQKGECLNPPLEFIPEGDWFCGPCSSSRSHNRSRASNNQMQTSSSRSQATSERRVIARTYFSERVRRNVNANRNNMNRSIEAVISRIIPETRPVRARTIFRRKRRKVKFKRRKTRTIKKRTVKKSPSSEVKIEPGTSKSSKETKETRKKSKKRRKIRRKRRVGKKPTKYRSYYTFKKKIQLTSNTAKGRIIQRILNTNTSRASSSGTSNRANDNLNHFNYALMDRDNEEFAPANFDFIVNK